jgi:hypothetical protein
MRENSENYPRLQPNHALLKLQLSQIVSAA